MMTSCSDIGDLGDRCLMTFRVVASKFSVPGGF